MPPEITKRPFGFDAGETEELVKKSGDATRRVYVDMIVKSMPDGRMIPLKFTWEDGREFSVGKVVDIRKGHSLKVFSPGLCFILYSCFQK